MCAPPATLTPNASTSQTALVKFVTASTGLLGMGGPSVKVGTKRLFISISNFVFTNEKRVFATSLNIDTKV